MGGRVAAAAHLGEGAHRHERVRREGEPMHVRDGVQQQHDLPECGVDLGPVDADAREPTEPQRVDRPDRAVGADSEEVVEDLRAR
eukprot:5909070-Prymnesium_polylepis.2